MEIGKLGIGEPGRRDAFHVPSVLATSRETLKPGDSVRFSGTWDAVSCAREVRHGVVDPFVDVKLLNEAGSQFWVLLEPGVVSDMVHHFQLNAPGMPEDVDTAESYDEEDDWCMGCD